MIWANRHGGGARDGTKAMLALTGMATLLPAICVLWFMTRAIRNERLAVQQRLTEVYTNHLASAEKRVTAFWRARADRLTRSAEVSPAAWFATLVPQP